MYWLERVSCVCLHISCPHTHICMYGCVRMYIWGVYIHLIQPRQDADYCGKREMKVDKKTEKEIM